MKVMLINPPNVFHSGDDFYVTFPLGLAYLAGYLEAHGVTVSVLDTLAGLEPSTQKIDGLYRVGMPVNDIVQEVRKYAPDLVGITCGYTVQYGPARDLAQEIKRKLGLPIIIGGAHCSALPEKVIDEECFDFVCIGEGEGPLLAVCRHFETGFPLEGVSGLAFKTANGTTITNKVPFSAVDTIPMPARHHFPMGEYINSDYSHNGTVMFKPYATMITSRGCPLNCTFCSVHNIWGRNNRTRDVVATVDEIAALRSDYGVKEIHFEDDMLMLNKARAISLCEEITDRGVDIAWTTPNGIYVNALDEKVLAAAKRSGCYQLALAVESGSPSVLKNLMKKNVSLDHGRRITKLMREMDLGVYFFFIIGMPGETKEDIIRTIEYAKEVCPDEAYFSIATPYPGTELYDTCVNNGYIPADYDLTLMKPTQPLIETEHLTRKDISDLCTFAYDEWNRAKKPTKFNSAADTGMERRGGVYTFA